MKIKQRFLNLFNRGHRAPARRGYSGAVVNRLTSSWIMSTTSADAEIVYQLSVLRSRCRELARNNDYARRYLKLVVMNVVGPTGIRLQSKVTDLSGKPDNGANGLIESAWWDWCRKSSLDGRMSFLELQKMAAETAARDGEIIFRKIVSRRAGNKYNFALQPLESDHLDEQYNDPDNNIRMGIKYDDFGRPVSYFLYKNHPGDASFRFSQRETIEFPASEIIHLYLKERPSQSRGVPWMHTAMRAMNDIEGYCEAEIVAARTAAAKMGFFVPPDGEYEGEKDDNNDYITEAEPGSFGLLPRGTDFKPWDPSHPSGNFDPFLKSMVRKMSSGLGVSYSSISSDLSDANYSSLRQGALVERDTWMTLQTWFIDNFMTPVFEAWLEAFLLSGLSNLPYSKYEKFNSPQWMARRWRWVDPLKDQEAAIAGVASALTSRSEILSEQGMDFEDLLDQLAWEQRMIDEKGVKISQKTPPTTGGMQDVAVNK